MTGALAQNRQSSQQFQTYKASGAPVPVTEARVTMFGTQANTFLRNLLTQIWAFILAVATQVPVALASVGELPASLTSFDLVPRPGLVIAISAKTTETVKNALVAAGFGEQTNGRYRYWVGPPTDQALTAAIKLGVVTDAFAPENNVSVNGLIAFSLINRIFHHAFVVLSSVTPHVSFDFVTTPVIAKVEKEFRFTEANLNLLPEKGFFFGYFDGMNLPDRSGLLRVFGKHFSLLLGKNARMVETMKALQSGWQTLHTTTSGRALAHMAYCIDTAIEFGIVVKPVFLAGEYSGCVFDTAKHGIVVGNTSVYPSSKVELTTSIQFMNSHESALVKIAELLSDLTITGDKEKKEAVSPNALTSPRVIHNITRARTVLPSQQPELTRLVSELRFTQQLWDHTNPRHVQQAIGLITRKEFPTEDVPFNLRLDGLWTKNPIYSVLSSFGVRAPSLRGKGTQLTRRIGKDMYNMTKPGRITGIPVFAKPHQEAKADWEGILREYNVWFDHKGSDKDGKLRIKDLSMLIPFETNEGKAIMNGLVAVTKKRGIDEVDEGEPGPTQEQLDEAAKAKRRRVKGYGMIGVVIPGVSDTLDMDEDEPDPFA